MKRQPLLVEDERIQFLVQRIVDSLRAEQDLRRDMLQEALIHLWQTELDRPGQTTSWYLQSCRFRLQHYLASGRSLDSLKRRCTNAVSFSDEQEASELLERLESGQDHFEETCARDLLDVIGRHLRPAERAVLQCLAEGLSTVEIVSKLGISAPTVTKYRRKIARVVCKLGMQSGAPAARVRTPLRESHAPELGVAT